MPQLLSYWQDAARLESGFLFGTRLAKSECTVCGVDDEEG